MLTCPGQIPRKRVLGEGELDRAPRRGTSGEEVWAAGRVGAGLVMSPWNTKQVRAQDCY